MGRGMYTNVCGCVRAYTNVYVSECVYVARSARPCMCACVKACVCTLERCTRLSVSVLLIYRISLENESFNVGGAC